jgi:hypothetical protein
MQDNLIQLGEQTNACRYIPHSYLSVIRGVELVIQEQVTGWHGREMCLIVVRSPGGMMNNFRSNVYKDNKSDLARNKCEAELTAKVIEVYKRLGTKSEWDLKEDRLYSMVYFTDERIHNLQIQLNNINNNIKNINDEIDKIKSINANSAKSANNKIKALKSELVFTRRVLTVGFTMAFIAIGLLALRRRK